MECLALYIKRPNYIPASTTFFWAQAQKPIWKGKIPEEEGQLYSINTLADPLGPLCGAAAAADDDGVCDEGG